MALSKRPERPPGNRVRTKRVSSQDVHRGGASARGGAEARVPTARRAQVRAASGGACAVRARTHVRAGPAPTRARGARGAQGAGAGGLLVWGSARQRAPGAEETARTERSAAPPAGTCSCRWARRLLTRGGPLRGPRVATAGPGALGVARRVRRGRAGGARLGRSAPVGGRRRHLLAQTPAPAPVAPRVPVLVLAPGARQASAAA